MTPPGRKRLCLGFLLGAGLALLFYILSLVLPTLSFKSYERKSLGLLKSQAQEIRREFAAVLDSIAQKKRLSQQLPRAETYAAIFDLFKTLKINPENEGVGYFDRQGHLALWLGNVIDIEDHVEAGTQEFFGRQKTSFLIRHKASVYLIAVHELPDQSCFAHFKLMAFIPQFQSSYLGEAHFLPLRLRKNTGIDYWDYREDISGFERIFSRSNDEYIGRPGEKSEIRTLFFPLRNEENRILATVTLSSPSLTTSKTALRESLQIPFYLMSVVSLFFLLAWALSATAAAPERRTWAGPLILLVLIGMRLLFLPLSRLDRIQSLSIFSPSTASFFSIGALTKSPADIFLTSLLVFLLVGGAAVPLLRAIKTPDKKPPRTAGFLLLTFSAIISFAALFAFQAFLRRLVFNSSIHLLRFSFSLSFMLLFLSIVFFLAAVLTASYFFFRAAALVSRGINQALIPIALGLEGTILATGAEEPLLQNLVQGLIVLGIAFLAFSPASLRKREPWMIALVLSAFYLALSMNHDASLRTRSLVEHFLRNAVRSQEHWGHYLIQQSIPEIEKESKAVTDFFKKRRTADMAHSLWEKTLIQKFNWYSSLEIVDPGGAVLSRFSLNVPKVSDEKPPLPPTREWVLARRPILFMGKEKDYLVCYKDWYEGDDRLGRTTLFLSLEPDILPFLFSANPYFELLRASPLPSLHQYSFTLAIYDRNGNLLFNPHRMTTSLPQGLLERLDNPVRSLWTRLHDRDQNLDAFYFSEGDRIYALFVPRKNIRSLSVDVLKIFFLELTIFILSALGLTLALKRERIRGIFRSFSNRVYAAFLAIAFIPLLLFTFFTQNLFDRVFTQQFIEEAAAHAATARSIMEDFVLILEQEQPDFVSPISPTEDMVHWISSTIANDVNLYEKGKLLSSSRREFFDAGLLPELIDGEIYYRVLYEKRPYYTQRQKIGDYDFQTLAIPYFFRDSIYLVSLPFPFQKEQTARSTRELVEFLFFLSVFFIILVYFFTRGIRAMIIVPIRKLLAGTRQVSLGNLEVAVDHSSQDEMKTLIEGFNAMIMSLKAHQQEIADMSKKVAWAEMARKVAHEIKNPLTPIQLSAEHLLKVYEDRRGDFEKALKESATYIISEVENLRRIAHEFIELSRDTKLRKEDFDLKDVIEDTLGPYKRVLAERIRFLEVYEGGDFAAKGEPAKIKIALRNIIINAIEAISGKGEIEIRAVRRAKMLRIEIRDTGAGMNEETLEKIFEPSFSTKEVGTGLGLPIARKIIEDHGGTIHVSSRPLEGTAVTIELPQA